MGKSKPTYDKATLRLFWGAVLENKSLAVRSLLSPIGGVFLFAIAPLVIGRIIASVATGGNATEYLPYFFGAVAIGILCNRFGFTWSLQHQAKTMGILEERAFKAVLRRSVSFHNNNIGGKIVSDIIDYGEAYNKLSGAVILQIGPLLLIMLAGSILVTIQSPLMGLFVVLMAAVAIGGAIYDSRSRFDTRHARLKVRKATTAHIADSVVNAQTVKTFGTEDREISIHKTHAKKLLKLRLKDWTTAGLQGNNRIILLSAMQAGFILATIYEAQRNPALIGAGIFGFAFATTVANRLFETSAVLRSIDDALLSASPMTQTILENPEIIDAPNASSLVVTDGTVAFSDVTFRYGDVSKTHPPVFKDLSLAIPHGQKIGLVGPSGGGKSTLTRLLLRFDDINSGTITIDGVNIADVSQQSLREAISYVPQEPLLFHRSIFDNIAYGKPNANKEAVIAAAKKANAHEFISSLENGYETIVGERGVKLSGGQRQRVAIARAILKDAPLLVLDEATSALDSESEVAIQSALEALMKGRTTIVIAHRLSTIQKLDRIIVLESGKIVEDGTHDSLIKHAGRYAKLWAHQSGGFIEE